MNIIEQKDCLLRDERGKFKNKYAKYKFNKNIQKWLLPSFKIDEDTQIS